MGRVHTAVTVGLAAACAYLLFANYQLRSRPEPGEAPDRVEANAPAPETDSDEPKRRARPSLLARLGGAKDRKRPELGKQDKETRAERRKRRSEEMRAFLGREDGESEEDYRDRLRPMVVAGLAEPRVRLENDRLAVEKAAGVSDEQRAAIDEVLEDTYAETMDLANQAIQNGDVSPYRRNWAGTLQVAGGVGAVLDATNRRIEDVLSAEQRRIMYEQGFEWGEYIGAKTPWEDLRPPPPPE